MKQTLLNIADQIDKRVAEFAAFPRTQATDAMTGIGTDISAIIRAEAETIEGDSIEDQIAASVKQALSDLTSPTKVNKKGGSQ